MASDSARRAYLAEHDVQTALKDAVVKALSELPADPIDFICDALQSGKSVKSAGPGEVAQLPARTFSQTSSKRNNILLMTDGYKFSHHKQYPVSWVPTAARPTGSAVPPILFPGSAGSKGSILDKILPVPHGGLVGSPMKMTLVTNCTTAVVDVEPATGTPDFTFSGASIEFTGPAKATLTVAISPEIQKLLGLPEGYSTVSFANVDESKLKRGSALNTFEGGYNVSYFTPRAYKDQFDGLAASSTGDHIVFFGLQYLIKEYLAGSVVTEEKVEEAEAFVARYMSDVRVAGPGVDHEGGYDYTMFPRGDWMAMVTGDYDGTGQIVGTPGALPIKIEALPEGTLCSEKLCLFKLTNTHPRFFWLPNFLETLLVQVWYPTTVATQTREFRKTIQAYSYLSERVSQIPIGPTEFTVDNIVENQLAIRIAQVFDLLDFGYRGVSSHETAALGSASYYACDYEGSDTVAGSRLCLWAYEGFKTNFENFHGATSIPAAEHSTVTSWVDMDPSSDPVKYQHDEYNAFANMFKQYMPSFGISLVSDGFNIWNSVANHWPSDEVPGGLAGGKSLKAMIDERLSEGRLNLLRPDSGEGIEALPQLLTMLSMVLPDHFVPTAELPALTDKFAPGSAEATKWAAVLAKIQAKVGTSGNPFRRFKGQNMRVLQGDGVALDTIGDMCASLLSNGFCVNAAHFGSGGGLLQKVNRDSLSFAFKCCAMYVGDKVYVIGKDPIAGAKKSYAGNPSVLRGPDGVLYNRTEPMTAAEFKSGGVKDDVLETVFVDGKVVKEQQFFDIRGRSAVTKPHLEAAIATAVDNLSAKVEFLQKMSTPAAMGVRLAEAACNAKWMHQTPAGTRVGEMKTRFPEMATVFDELGLKDSMDSVAIKAHLVDQHVCTKKAAKSVLALVTEGDMEAATAKMGDKTCITL